MDSEPGVQNGSRFYQNARMRIQKSEWHLLELQEFLNHVVEDEEDKDHLEAQHHKVFEAHITEQLQQKRGVVGSYVYVQIFQDSVLTENNFLSCYI